MVSACMQDQIAVPLYVYPGQTLNMPPGHKYSSSVGMYDYIRVQMIGAPALTGLRIRIAKTEA